ncbi:MAG: cupredoxin domain-containing protein [Candidatus Paceibacteria bacterium]
MNKYLSLLIFAVFLLSSGYVYSKYYRPEGMGAANISGRTVEMEMRILKNKWKWEPAEIKVGVGDYVRIKIYNEDDYDHGFALDIFGINRRLFPLQTTIVEFTASNAGRFNFYCSVPCGEGHYEQAGVLIVE